MAKRPDDRILFYSLDNERSKCSDCFNEHKNQIADGKILLTDKDTLYLCYRHLRIRFGNRALKLMRSIPLNNPTIPNSEIIPYIVKSKKSRSDIRAIRRKCVKSAMLYKIDADIKNDIL
jgi:hypothetical protein